jgi:tetratricopeptide (TPR) repeat protein
VPHIRDFEPILPDPQPYIEKALALYDRAARGEGGRVVFITAELGGGKTEHLSALAKALHQAKPKPAFVAGYFSGGEYRRYTLAWQKNICLSKAVLAAGETAALLSLFPSAYALAVSFLGQLLQTTVSAHELGGEFKNNPPPRKESADWLRKLLRRTAEERPLVCLLDNWDEAQRFFWDDMLLSFSREIAHGLPLLLFVTVKEPIDLKAPEKDESGLAKVIKTLTEEKGLAELWPLRKLSRDEVAASIGYAAPGIAAKLHGVTGGNARWVRELWREWRLSEIVAQNEADCWVWGEQHKATVNLYEDILRDRLTRLLKAQMATEVEEAREVLACAALEGMRFTSDAVALTLGWDSDELIDFLDEELVQTEDNPDGLLLEDESVSITMPGGATRTLWRYSFVSDLHWTALARYGFADQQRPGKGDSEKLEKSAALAQALIETYAPEERLVAAPLARLLRDIGQRETAQHYQRMADYAADRAVMREQALHLLTINKDEWGQWECGRVAKFLIEAGKVMGNVFPFSEMLAVSEEACKLAHRAKDESDEAYAHYLCGVSLHVEGENRVARDRVSNALDIWQRIRFKQGIAVSLHMLADIDYVEGHYVEARAHALQSLKIDQELGKQHGVAALCTMLADIDFIEGHYVEARAHALQSLKIDQKLGNQEGIAHSYKMLADIDCGEGRYIEARAHALQSLKIMQELGDQSGVAVSLNILANIDFIEGHYVEARAHALQSLKIMQELGNQEGIANSLDLLGSIASTYIRPKEALNLTTLGALIMTQIGHAEGQHIQNHLTALLAEQRYTEEQRQELFHQVSEAYRKDGGREWIENALARLGEAGN